MRLETKDDLYFNIIGIGKTGKDILDRIDDSILDYFMKNRFYTHVIPSLPLYIDVLGDFYLKKYYINDLSDVINIRNNRSFRNDYYNIIIYDDCDYDLANELVKNLLGESLFLNIGVCINGNKKIDKLKVIETNNIDAKDVVFNLIACLFPTYSTAAISEMDYIGFFEDEYKYKAFNAISKSLRNEHNILEEKIGNIKDNVIDTLILVTTKNQWTLLDQVKLVYVIRNGLIEGDKGFYQFKESPLDDEIVTVICKIKE